VEVGKYTRGAVVAAYFQGSLNNYPKQSFLILFRNVFAYLTKTEL